MPISYRVDQSGVVVTLEWGRVSLADGQAHLRAVAGDARVPRPVQEIYDKRQVTDLPIDYALSVGYAEDAARLFRDGGAGRMCYLVTSDLVYGKARQIQQLLDSHGVTVAVYRSLEEACAWIGLPPQALHD